MTSSIELRHLALMVRGLHQDVEIEESRLSALMSSTDARLSKHHSQFAELLSRYSAFADGYKRDISTFYQSLLHEVETQQQKEEAERVEKLVQDKLETMSNKSNKSNNLEITENVQDAEYSPAASMANEVKAEETSSDDEPPKTSSVPIHSLPSPQEMKSRDSIPRPTDQKKSKSASRALAKRGPAPKSQAKGNKQSKQNKQNKKKASKKSKGKVPSTSSAAPAVAPLPTESRPEDARKAEPVAVEEKKAESVPLSSDHVEHERYVYDAERVRWRFVAPIRSTTVVYIGNIPANIKVAAVQFLVMKRAKVSMRQIEETELRKAAYGSQFALVRFRSDVAMDKVTAFMNSINRENAQIAEQRKQNDGELEMLNLKKAAEQNKSKSGKQSKTKTSWQTRVFVRFNDNRKWYESEQEMYADPAAKHKLFIRNFDIVDAQCHEEMTMKLLEFGDIYQDIEMGTDSFADPYCVVTFKSLDDAIYCRNSSIEFNGRWLEIEYLNARTMRKLFG
jgi:hypothetical protein